MIYAFLTHFANSARRFVILTSAIALLVLTACASGVYQTEEGCGFAEATPGYTSLVLVKWSGKCEKDRLAGTGQLILKYQDGSQQIYEGGVFQGYRHGQGVLTWSQNRWEGVWNIGKVVNGKLFVNGVLDYSGTGTPAGNVGQGTGTFYYPSGTEFTGEIVPGAKSLNATTGVGFEYGVARKNGEVTGRFVNGRSYPDESSYAAAILQRSQTLKLNKEIEARRLAEEYAQQSKLREEQRNRETKQALQTLSSTLGTIAQQRQDQKANQQSIAEATRRQQAAMPSSISSRPSEGECFQKIIAIQKQSDMYLVNQQQKELFEGECSHHSQARAYVNAAVQTMREMSAHRSASQTPATSNSSSQQSNLDRSLADKRMSDEVERKNKENEKQRLLEINRKKLSESLALQKARELELAARVNEQQIKRQREEQEQKEAALERHRREVAFERATSASISAELNQPNAVTVNVMNHRCPHILIRNNMRRAKAIVTIDVNISGIRQGGGPHKTSNTITFLLHADSKNERAAPGGGFDCDQPWNVTTNVSWIEGKQN